MRICAFLFFILLSFLLASRVRAALKNPDQEKFIKHCRSFCAGERYAGNPRWVRKVSGWAAKWCARLDQPQAAPWVCVVLLRESRLNPLAVGKAGERGMGQATRHALAVWGPRVARLGLKPDLANSEFQVALAASEFCGKLERHAYNYQAAASAYNGSGKDAAGYGLATVLLHKQIFRERP